MLHFPLRPHGRLKSPSPVLDEDLAADASLFKKKEERKEKKKANRVNFLHTCAFEIKRRKVAIRQMCKLRLCAIINHDSVNYTLCFLL